MANTTSKKGVRRSSAYCVLAAFVLLPNCFQSTEMYGFSKFPAAMFVLAGALATLSLWWNLRERQAHGLRLNWLAGIVAACVVFVASLQCTYIAHHLLGGP